jgi:hypothetical protein
MFCPIYRKFFTEDSEPRLRFGERASRGDCAIGRRIAKVAHAFAVFAYLSDQFIGVSALAFSMTRSEVLRLRKDTAAVSYHAFSAPDIADLIGHLKPLDDRQRRKDARSPAQFIHSGLGKNKFCVVTHIAQQSHCGHNLSLWMGEPCKGKHLPNNTFEPSRPHHG